MWSLAIVGPSALVASAVFREELHIAPPGAVSGVHALHRFDGFRRNSALSVLSAAFHGFSVFEGVSSYLEIK